MDRSIIITGATGDMGREAVRILAEKGCRIIMACRNVEKALKLRDELLRTLPYARLEIGELRLESMDSVRQFASGMQGRRIDGLFNNAGAMPRHHSLSPDGYEYTTAVNYLGPWLLTRLLLPVLAPDARIVNMISVSCHKARVDRDFFQVRERDFRQIGTYANAKLALLYFSILLSERCSQKVNVADPGIVNTGMIRLERWFDPLANFFFRPFCNSPLKGVRPAVNALDSEVSCHLFRGRGHHPVSDEYRPEREVLEWLWDETSKITGIL